MLWQRVVGPGLLRLLLGRTLLVGLVPLFLLAAVSLTFSENLVYERFQEESGIVADRLAADLADRVLLASRSARLIAELDATRDVIGSTDVARMRALMLPLKGRLGLDIVNLYTPDGHLIVGGQDARTGDLIDPESLALIDARTESSWVLGEDADGLVVRAIAPVRSAGRLVGIVETGLVFDSRLLRALQSAGAGTTASGAQLALGWRGSVRAATLDLARAIALPGTDEIGAAPGQRLVRTVTLGSERYYAVFTPVESHRATLAVLAALLPLAPVENVHTAILMLLVALVGGLVLFVAISAYRFAAALTRPLHDLAAAAQRIEAGDLSASITVHSQHEIGTLERSFEMMARSLEQRETTNRELVSELEDQALYDPLSRLPNRVLVLDRLEQLILSTHRKPTSFALIIIDLDRFKDINDTFGHHVGDEVLREVGPRLKGGLRESDTIARLGGDEFALLLPTATDEQGAIHAATKVLGALEAPFVIESLSLEIEASLGIAMFPEHGGDAETLIRHADAAMYDAKKERSRFATYSAGAEGASRERLLILGELRQAIALGQLALHYQPIVDPTAHTVRGVEALVRWIHPRLGTLTAAKFVPFAEQTGIFRALAEWVLSTALEQSSRWSSTGLELPISINLSAREIPDNRLPNRIAQALDEAGVAASALRVEITESAVMTDPARSLEVLRRLREVGVGVSIDDFGTGYSSLAYLNHLPVDEIKIDHSFVSRLRADRGTQAIVQATIELGHNLGLRVVAEGVEGADVIGTLARMHCDLVQGHYVSWPLAGDDIAAWVASSGWTYHGKTTTPTPLFRDRLA